MNSARLLKIIFVILLLVTLGELGYYLYILKGSNMQTNNKTAASQRSSLTPSTSVSQNELSGNEVNLLDFRPATMADSDFALNRALIQNLYTYNRDTLISSVITNQFQGEIKKLEIKDGVTPSGFKYKVDLILKGKSFSKGFFYNNSDLNLIKIVKLQDKNEIPIQLEELKNGDTIMVSEAINMTKSCDNDECLIGLKITKI